MKKIITEIKRIIVSGHFDRYRLIITEDIIELRLSAKCSSVKEIDWSIKNEKYAKQELYWQLKKNH